MSMKEITAEQYRKLSVYWEDITEDILIRILLGKEKGEMTLKEIDEIDFTGFKMPTANLIPDLVYHDGVLYGKQNMEELTFGLYIDLMAQLEDIQKNLIKIMTMLWRPVAKISYANRVKAYLISKMLQSKSERLKTYAFRMLANLKFKIQDYDVVESFDRVKSFETLPASYAVYTTTFFLLTSNRLAEHSLKSLKEHLQTTQLELTESLKSLFQDGDGIPTFGSLPEKKQSE